MDFNTNQENNISLNGATISFASKSFSEDIVHIDVSYHDSNITTQVSFPGDFTAIENNQTFPITSYGFFHLQLKDSQGDKVTLLKNAHLSFPITQGLNLTQTLSLCSYNKETKV